jgi:hypothetical protein
MSSLGSFSRLVMATLMSTGALSAPVSAAGSAQARDGERAPAADVRRDMIGALPADGPHPSLGGEAGTFDRLVGTWDCDYTFHAEDGTITRAAGELRFGWILDGRAVQDIWITYPQGPNEERLIGTSVRFFDAKKGVWRVVFVLPALELLTIVEGRAQGDRIVLEGQTSDGKRRRWSFNDITPSSFVWRGERSRDGGKTWRLAEEHHMKRRTER